jgi:hypothetical protein
VVLLVGVLLAEASEETPRIRINYLAYPGDWNGKTGPVCDQGSTSSLL